MVRITMNTSHLVGNCHVRAWFWQSCRRVHHRSSRLIQPLKSAQKVKSAEEHCLSHGLLVDYGIIRGVEEGAGLYNYLPLAVRYFPT